jgi:hypothetical protein
MAVIDPSVLDGLPAEVIAFLHRIAKTIPTSTECAAMALFMTLEAAEDPDILDAINDPELGFYDLTPEQKQRLFAILFTSDPPPRMDSLHA